MHTGQHYDDELSRVFFDELGVPAPDRELNAGGGSNTEQTARILGLLEGVVDDATPDLVLVYGDTNSTLAGALAAAQARVPVAHVEAGMRSFDRTMPEELNRVLTDHAQRPAAVLDRDRRWRTSSARARAGEAHLVGDVMADVSLAFRPIAEERSTVARRPRPGAGRVRARHRAPRRATSTTPSAWRGSWRCSRRCRARPSSRCTRAPPRSLDAAGLRDRLEAAGHARCPPLGYLDFMKLADARARGAHRLRRSAEGGLPARRAVRDPARHHRMGRDGGGGLEHARRPRRGGGASPRWSARRRASGPSCTAAAARGERVVDVLRAVRLPRHDEG